MLNVLQVCTEFPFRGGIQRHVLELSKALERLDVNVTVLATNPGGRQSRYEKYENIQIVRFRSLSPNNAYHFAPFMFSYLARLRTSRTVVHVHNYQALPALTAAFAKSFNRLPIVFTPHFHPMGGTDVRSALKTFYRPLGRLMFDTANVVIALSDYERSVLQAFFSLSASKIRVIPAGSSPPRARLQRHSRTILYVGRLEKYKGVDIVIEALPIILQQLASVRLVIVGSGPDKARLRRLTSERGVSDQVAFLGNVTDAHLERIFSSAGLLVLASRYEAYSLIIGEALERGVPVIASRVGAIPEIYGKMKGCVLVDYPPTVDELAKSVLDLLRRAERFRSLPLAGKGPLTRHSWDDVARTILHLYEQLL